MLVDTPHGPARVHLAALDRPRGLLVLGHGAGGGVTARDLATAAEAGRRAGLSVALVEQPYRVAGRRSPPPASQLDAAWLAAVEGLTADVPLVVGGRSSGARVACRTAEASGAVGVVCLAFPLQPARPGSPDRLAELDAVRVPVLVVQGASDPFGMPPSAPGRTVVQVKGDHTLRSDLPALAAALETWLPGVLRASPSRRTASSSPSRS